MKILRSKTDYSHEKLTLSKADVKANIEWEVQNGPITQSFTKYLRLTLVFKIVHYEKSLISDFEEFFASINKISFSKEDQALGNYSMKFRHLPDIF